MVVAQQPAQPRPATKVGAGADAAMFGRDQLVAEALVVPLAVVVRHELVEDATQAPFSEEDEPIETLFANRAHEPLRVGIGVRRLNRRPNNAHPRAFHDEAKSVRPLRVPVTDDHPIADEEPIDGVGRWRAA